MTDDPIRRAELRIPEGLGEMLEPFRAADKLDLFNTVLAAVVRLERITDRSQAAELARQADELRVLVDAARLVTLPFAGRRRRGWHSVGQSDDATREVRFPPCLAEIHGRLPLDPMALVGNASVDDGLDQPDEVRGQHRRSGSVEVQCHQDLR